MLNARATQQKIRVFKLLRSFFDRQKQSEIVLGLKMVHHVLRASWLGGIGVDVRGLRRLDIPFMFGGGNLPRSGFGCEAREKAS